MCCGKRQNRRSKGGEEQADVESLFATWDHGDEWTQAVAKDYVWAHGPTTARIYVDTHGP